MTKEEIVIHMKAYREANKEKRELMPDWQEASVKERRAIMKLYKDACKEHDRLTNKKDGPNNKVSKNKAVKNKAVKNKAYMKVWNKANKEKREAYRKAYIRTVKGLIVSIYGRQKKSSKKRGHQLPTYSKEELHVWITSQSNFKELYDNWIASDCDMWLIPSVDRLDDAKGYSFNNIQLITWRENHEKGLKVYGFK